MLIFKQLEEAVKSPPWRLQEHPNLLTSFVSPTLDF